MDLYAKLYQPILLDTIRIEAPDCYRCPYGACRDTCSTPCFSKAEETFARYADQCCAMIIEPLLQGSAGMRMYPAQYLIKLRNLCDQYHVLLIADEIATGFGRTGKMFAFDHAGVCPDLMCISKGLTGGYLPMAITVTTDQIYDAFYADYSEGKAFLHSHTYSGNPLGCAAALAVQQILRDGTVLQQAAKRAAYLTKQLEEALGNHPHIGEIRHLGLIHAMELVVNRQSKEEYDSSLRIGYQIYNKALEKGLLLRPLGNVLYFNPPLIIQEWEIDQAVAWCKEAIADVLGK